MVSKILKFGKQKGSSALSPAHGLGGAKATILSFPLSVPPPKKIAGGFQQAGEKEEIRYEKKSSDFVNNLFNQTTGKRYSVL
ncbi:hypothetical protein KJ743_00185, partial [Patescibacteria group bacterium]|nr:hypothetical protein [Patescibacteria group bacterium]